MESSLPILLLSGAGVLSSVLFALGAVLERRRAEHRSRAAEQALEARSRYLGLLAQEMQGHGLALLGYATAPRAPAGRDAGLEGRARALMGLSADVSDLLAQGAGPAC
ncbi:hypothetical protein ACFQU7_11475 [Pseudoroseomonas wenyumeiae]